MNSEFNIFQEHKKGSDVNSVNQGQVAKCQKKSNVEDLQAVFTPT